MCLFLKKKRVYSWCKHDPETKMLVALAERVHEIQEPRFQILADTLFMAVMYRYFSPQIPIF